jgi:hypothetical protein
VRMLINHCPQGEMSMAEFSIPNPINTTFF